MGLLNTTITEIWVSLKHVLLCKYDCPASWSRDLMLVMYCVKALFQVTRKDLNWLSMTRVMIHWDSKFNQWYLLIQIKISQMEKSVLMISMFNVKYINWHFLLAKVTLEMGKGSVTALLFFYLHGSWLKYTSMPLHTNVSV